MIWKILLVISLGDLVLSENGAVSEQRVVMHHQKPEQKKYPSSDGEKNSEYHEEYAWSYPSYEFSYKVKDPETHDEKGQHEKREGDEVKGLYWLIEPDGHKRTVNYEANGNEGFNAQVDVSPKRENSGPNIKIVTHNYEVVEIVEENEAANAKGGDSENNKNQEENVTEQQNNANDNMQGGGVEEENNNENDANNDGNQTTVTEENTENNSQGQGETSNQNNEESQNNENDNANDINENKNNLSEISNDTKMKNEGKQKIRRENKGYNSNNSNHVRHRVHKSNKNSVKVNNVLNGGNSVHRGNQKNNKLRHHVNDNINIPTKNYDQREVIPISRDKKHKEDTSSQSVNIKAPKKENKTIKNNNEPKITLVDIEANNEDRNINLNNEKDVRSEHRIRIHHPRFIATKSDYSAKKH